MAKEQLQSMLIRVTSKQAAQLTKLREEGYSVAPLIRKFVSEGLAKMETRRF